ncbi:MAG TPA: helix-turn-helix domain-containing protein [Opitutaceae bacterium]
MQNIGERLEEARKRKGISIREAAEATKIRGEYLQKFEGNQFEIGLTEIYTRGFLRGYANYLRIPSDRLLSDYATLRGGEVRPRPVSREAYGRMDLSSSSAEEREAPSEAASDSPARSTSRFQRPGENLPKQPSIDPAVMFKAGKILLLVIGLLIVVWIVKSLIGSSPAAPARASSAAAETAEVSGPAPTVSIVATETVRIKVVRKSDEKELFQGQLLAGEHREFPNVPIFLTASDLGAVQIDYKGRRNPTGFTGYQRIQFDFSNR